MSDETDRRLDALTEELRFLRAEVRAFRAECKVARADSRELPEEGQPRCGQRLNNGKCCELVDGHAGPCWDGNRGWAL